MRLTAHQVIVRLLGLLLFFCAIPACWAQRGLSTVNPDGTVNHLGDGGLRDSTSSSSKDIPKGMRVWTVDERFGDRIEAEVDTTQHMFMNTLFTSGLRGEYNTLGNLGAPRENRIFADRQLPAQFMFTQPYDYFITPVEQFHFTNTLSPITNLSYNECGDKVNGEDHLKALFAVNAGKKLGAGFKFDYLYGRGYFQHQGSAHFNYTMYGSYLGDRYQAHLLLSTNHQKLTENGGVTNDNYVSHPESFEDDFRSDEIPTVLESNWNRNDNQHVFLTHRYMVGFNRKVPMTEEEIKAKKFALASQKEAEERKKKADAARQAQKEGRDFDESQYEKDKTPTYAGRPDDAVIAGDEPAAAGDSIKQERIAVTSKEMADSLVAQTQEEAADTSWMKNEYVPVTSFIHTLKLDNYRRIYQAYNTPADYYLNTFPVIERLQGDSVYDKMRHYELRNTLAVSLLEGFNKWAKAGLKGFVTHDLRYFEMPDTVRTGFKDFKEHSLSVGGQLAKTQGSLLHYNATFETWLAGEDAGQLKLDVAADLNFKFLGDTVRLAARGYFYKLHPTFYQRHFSSKHLWWDNDKLKDEERTRLEGIFYYEKTRTKLRVAVDNLTNFTYFTNQYTITDTEGRSGNTVGVVQSDKTVNLLTLQLSQDFTLGPLNWESQVTYQKSGKQEALPLPDLNIYSNLYLNFKIAKVLQVHLGGDVRFFTKYEAPDYCPYIGQFCNQGNGDGNVKIGNYPIVNVYANMLLKRTRFFVMMSHVNAGEGGNRFLVPHYPVNGRILRLGLSWNFDN